MIKQLFIFAAAFGLLLNLYSDLSIWKQNKSSVQTGNFVHASYEVDQAIDDLRIALLDSSPPRGRGVLEKLEKLKSLTKDSPDQRAFVEKLANLSESEILTTRRAEFLLILKSMDSVEDRLLASRLDADEKLNQAVMAQTLYANIGDIFLIALFLGFFFYERKTAKKLQGALSKMLVDFESHNQSLSAALAMKNTQLKTTVHDLKNPLGSIRGFAELICDGSFNQKAILDMASAIQKVSDRSLSLVGSLLEESSEEREKWISFELIPCLKDACLFLKPLAEEKKQTIKVECEASDFKMMGDRDKVQNVFFNLLGNAIKFSPEGSVIKVKCLNHRDTCEIRFEDSGPGFTPQDLKNVFGEGVTLSAKPTGKESSTGFGLFSAKRTVHALGGEISCSNLPLGGACLAVHFPVGPASRSGQG